MKILLYLTLLITSISCVSTSIPEVTLTAFPETNTEYTYKIFLPEKTHSAVIFWYYNVERKENIIYQSGVVPINYGNITTEMYFSRPGAYILAIYAGTPQGIKKMRYKYAVRRQF
jgi:hypothetical protein